MENNDFENILISWPNLLEIADKKNLQVKLEYLESLPKYQVSLEENFSKQECEYINYVFKDKYKFIQKIAEIKKILNEVDILDLVISYDISHKKLQEVISRLRTSIKDVFIVDFKVDKTLIAGIRVGWKGKWYDYSLSDWLIKQSNN